jgi:hypothetical protein
MSNNDDFPYDQLEQLLEFDVFDLESVRQILGLSADANEWIKTAMQQLVEEKIISPVSEVSWRCPSLEAKKKFASCYL